MNIRELLWEAARSETQRALPILSFPAVQKMDAVADPRRQRVADHPAEVYDAHRGVPPGKGRVDLFKVRPQLIGLPADHDDLPLHGKQL